MIGTTTRERVKDLKWRFDFMKQDPHLSVELLKKLLLDVHGLPHSAEQQALQDEVIEVIGACLRK